MSNWFIVIVLLFISIGYFLLGVMIQMRKTHYWIIQWIRTEHDLARLENRNPKKVDEVKP